MAPRTLLRSCFLLVSASIAAASSASGLLTELFAINPSSISLNTRAAWCQSEINVCTELCGNTSDNTCDISTLKFTCTCSDGTSPDLNIYTGTIPYYACEETYTTCVEEHVGDAAGQEDCATSIRSQCATLDAGSVTSTTTTSESSTKASPTSVTTTKTTTTTGVTDTPKSDGTTDAVTSDVPTSTSIPSSQSITVTRTGTGSSFSPTTTATTVVSEGSSTASSLSSATTSTKVLSTGSSPSPTNPPSSEGSSIGSQVGRGVGAGLSGLFLLYLVL